MPQQRYIYSDNWRNCEGRHGVNQGGELRTPIGASALTTGWCHFEDARTPEGEVNCIFCLILIPYSWL